MNQQIDKWMKHKIDKIALCYIILLFWKNTYIMFADLIK